MANLAMSAPHTPPSQLAGLKSTSLAMPGMPIMLMAWSMPPAVVAAVWKLKQQGGGVVDDARLWGGPRCDGMQGGAMVGMRGKAAACHQLRL